MGRTPHLNRRTRSSPQCQNRRQQKQLSTKHWDPLYQACTELCQFEPTRINLNTLNTDDCRYTVASRLDRIYISGFQWQIALLRVRPNTFCPVDWLRPHPYVFRLLPETPATEGGANVLSLIGLFTTLSITRSSNKHSKTQPRRLSIAIRSH